MSGESLLNRARQADGSGAEGTGTRLVHAGRDPMRYHGFVNTPVFRASTVLSPTVRDLLGRTQPYIYGRRGTPTSEALERAVCELEGGVGAVLCPSGLSACTLALLSCLKPGDHLLVTEAVYGPVRQACDGLLRRLGIEVDFFPPGEGDGLAARVRANTRAVYLESPGSHSMEVQDVPALVAVARRHGLRVIADGSWATPLFFRGHALGVDLVIQAGTKYLLGHSDGMLGTVSASAEAWPALKALHGELGLCAGPDEIFLALRGLRTLQVRMKQHEQGGLEVARWLQQQPEVARVLHPALEGSPGHALWKRDFTGASGLFTVVLKPVPFAAVEALLDGLQRFGLGYSWGGYESLALPLDASEGRLQALCEPGCQCVRLHIGLEDPRDLIADLRAGLDRMQTVDMDSLL
ncbi:MAG TPA: cystathionine beta-lyase [Burkholderiaceae bacterium]|nr:cystathionine beta-lyase [Burkholderiaceae bacterium]